MTGQATGGDGASENVTFGFAKIRTTVFTDAGPQTWCWNIPQASGTC